MAASLTDPRFKENFDALKAVQPEDLSATEIDVRLGAAWVPAEDIEKFCQELLGATDIEVSHSHVIGTWIVGGDYFAKRTVANTTEWGTDRAGALDLIQDALNLRTPTIYDKEPGSDKFIVNAPATEGAREKQEKIKGKTSGKPAMKKRTMSAAGRKAIAAFQKARWAKIRAAKK